MNLAVVMLTITIVVECTKHDLFKTKVFNIFLWGTALRLFCFPKGLKSG